MQTPNPEARLFSAKEVAARLGISSSRVYRLFRSYPGVLHISDSKPGKRSYVTLRIPEFVLQRWIRQHTLPELSPAKKSLLY